MPAAPRQATLAQQHLRWLVSLFLALVMMILALALGLVLWPLAERSADDLAAMMMLSAQTWAELPPETRPAFEAELLREHGLAVDPRRQLSGEGSHPHGFYLRFVEQALVRRQGQPTPLTSTGGPDGLPGQAAPATGPWIWASIHTGEQDLAIGFAASRVQTRPLWALVVAVLAGVSMASVAALWLARRIAQPVARLEKAAAQLATGASPDLLPRTGPRELADLAGHFNQMALQVRELLAARTTLLAGISHDLRTPLARMRLALELLTLKPAPNLIARLEHDIEEMDALIGQALSLARGLDPEPAQTLDLQPWLQNRLDQQAPAAAAAQATLALRCPQGLRISAPPALLGRLLDNLLSNAIRYAAGPIELVAQTSPESGSAGIRLSVQDRGPGIPAEALPAVWQAFHRLDTSRSRQTGGVGLGLAIVRQIAQSQAWLVGLEARPNGGLCAWVEMPHTPVESSPALPSAL